ncbi:diaminopimelate decarboxylase [Liquorilactobacillus oeni]|uniref:Diaminopimelate decarboxylase n=1 Tax=Liquorilactobacillus oeni DSM 19972 TaxID=1423777 RepID=A0A0R1MFW0_9LACO|nr:diaminopimelate decarboxylase [Liquorilactobacillus oeni]KRL04213.1 Diaminopimelate decarboxylase [Liquorilactobacillus oeni DSM 19972]
MTKLSETVEINGAGHLAIGGVDALKLAKKYGTPLIAYDVAKIKNQVKRFKQAFIDGNVPYRVTYASKAFSALAMYRLISKEGLGCDVVSGGELYAALKGGMPPEKIEFHGNNKLPEELELAVDSKIGCIVVDNFQEISFLDNILKAKKTKISVTLRVAPGVEAETHKYISTGQENSKFGFDVRSGQAEKALKLLLDNPRMNLKGVHCHIGSQIFAAAGFVMAINKMVQLLKAWKEKYDFTAEILNIGGGFGTRYIDSDEPLPADEFVKQIVKAVKEKIAEAKLKFPEIWIEPGRALVGESAVTLYTVGSRKDVEGVCHFVSVDGGMGDNIRPALYQAKYEAVLANKPQALKEQIVTVVGKYCESGDILVRDALLPVTHPNDTLAILSTGAYGYTMASNYNRNPRPAVVFCENGKDKLVIKRETYADMLRCELSL